MTRIQLWRARDIPGFLVCRVDEETGTYSTDEQNSILAQSDWDYPSLASSFGWNMRDVQRDAKHWKTGKRFVCLHDSTDGTVKCDSCGLTAIDFIQAAQEYLDTHLGTIIEDPGYFAEVQS